MDVILLLAGLAVGTALGAVIGFLYARIRMAGVTADLTARAQAADERARAAHDQAALVDGYLADRFQALSAQALDASQQRLLETSELRMRAANLAAASELDSRRHAVEQLVDPLRQTLARVETQLAQAEAARQTSHAALTEQVKFAMAASEQLRAQTQALVTALRRPEARGRWGEMQLRRVAELAGMSARCDFDEQVTAVASGEAATGAGGAGATSVRPDMVVRLAGGKNIVVDSKVSLAAYLEAAEAADEKVRDARLAAHARHLKEHVDRLAAKSYWSALTSSPEFVVLFIPGEAFLAPALEREPGLLEYAMARRVHIATPTTLVTMLRTAQYAWQQDALSENARAVFDLGRELYDRLAGLGAHVDSIGKSLAGAVAAYNRSVGTLEGRVLVTARKLHQLGVTDAELTAPSPIELAPRTLSASELAADAAPQLTAVVKRIPGSGPPDSFSGNGPHQPVQEHQGGSAAMGAVS
jgi:DNA recombination protein RmuC